MLSQTLDIVIERTPQAVFDVLSDPAGLPRWNPTFRSAAWSSSGAPGVGSGFTASVKVLGSKDVAAEITHWDPPRLWGYELRTPVFPMDRFDTLYTLDPDPGGTQLTVRSRTELARSVCPLEGLIAKVLGDREIWGNLARLKRLLGSRR